MLDALLPLLPAGTCTSTAEDVVEISASARRCREAGAGGGVAGGAAGRLDRRGGARRLARAARRGFGGGAVLIVGPAASIRSPWDPPAPDGSDRRRGRAAAGARSARARTRPRRCASALLLDLEPAAAARPTSAAASGTLAIAAAKLGWAPVVGRRPRAGGDRGRARERARATASTVDVRAWPTSRSTPLPLAPLLLVNAPPPVHARVAAAIDARGPARDRLGDRRRARSRRSCAGYRAAGFEAGWPPTRGSEDEWIALRLSC